MVNYVKEGDLPQKEVIRLLRISGNRIKKLREEHMSTEDWYTSPTKGRPSIFYRPSGIAKLQIHHAAARILPLAVPRFQQAVMLPLPPNKQGNRIWARVKQQTGKWEKHPVLITQKIARHLRPGKPFKVNLVEDENGNKSYRHEILCP